MTTTKRRRRRNNVERIRRARKRVDHLARARRRDRDGRGNGMVVIGPFEVGAVATRTKEVPIQRRTQQITLQTRHRQPTHSGRSGPKVAAMSLMDEIPMEQVRHSIFMQIMEYLYNSQGTLPLTVSWEWDETHSQWVDSFTDWLGSF